MHAEEVVVALLAGLAEKPDVAVFACVLYSEPTQHVQVSAAHPPWT